MGTKTGTMTGPMMDWHPPDATALTRMPSRRRRLVAAPRPLVSLGLVALAVVAAVAPEGVANATTENQITLVSSEPATAEVLSAAPTAIVLQFDQEVPLAVQDTGTLTCAGSQILTGDGEYETNRTKLTYPITGAIGRGTCIFTYQLVDGAGADVGSATLSFLVETGAVTSAPAAGSTTTAPPATTGPTTAPAATTGPTTAPAATTGSTTSAPAATTGSTVQTEASTGFDPGSGFGLVVFTAAVLILFGALAVITYRTRRTADRR